MQLRDVSLIQFITFVTTILLGSVLANRFTDLTGLGAIYDSKRILVLCFIGFSTFLLCMVKKLYIELPTVKQSLIITATLSCAIISAILSDHPYWGLVEISNILMLLIACSIFYNWVQIVTRHELTCLLFFSAVLFSAFHFTSYLLYLLFSYFEGNSLGNVTLVSGYDNIRFFNQLQVVVYPFLSLVVFIESLKKYKKIALLLASLHCLVLLQTEARGAILALVFSSILVGFYLCSKHKSQFGCFIIKSFSFGFILWGVLIALIPFLLFSDSDMALRTSSSGRLELWAYAINNIIERPWAGFGPMSFAWAADRPLPNAHLHNSILQLLYEYGIPICIMILGIFFMYLKHLLGQLAIPDEKLESITFSIVAVSVYSLFSGVLVMPFTQLLLSLVIALSLSNKQNRKKHLIGVKGKIVIILVTIFCLSMVLGSYEHNALKNTQHPRVWLNGAIEF
ncbi:O-antigen ligase family protein [Shewanella sp. 10N.7]|uniref:O-antigen ligase family protein n=1 Tax=Shewanella sp. 10N.7 TaxID=2885093 RepID=UPI001E2CC476|nr:O-antigen ligase family protein [Shewanella sp. 10N.7]MCC4832944.1 O-antigen ligase family protein [Shewanella sp. 10N.7]